MSFYISEKFFALSRAQLWKSLGLKRPLKPGELMEFAICVAALLWPLLVFSRFDHLFPHPCPTHPHHTQPPNERTILDTIIDHKRRVELPHLAAVDRAALAALPTCRGFTAALKREADAPIQVIAESKKGSPSKGIFTEDYDPVRNAYHYQLGGAAAMSVLTDERFFFGHLDHLIAVREAVELPLIRKDFVVDERQIAEARLVGADAVLLIVACLEKGLLATSMASPRTLASMYWSRFTTPPRPPPRWKSALIPLVSTTAICTPLR